MTPREIIEAAGGIFKGTQSGSPRGDMLLFESPDMPGVTMSLYASAIRTVEDVQKHIDWKRAQFADVAFLQSQWEKS